MSGRPSMLSRTAVAVRLKRVPCQHAASLLTFSVMVLTGLGAWVPVTLASAGGTLATSGPTGQPIATPTALSMARLRSPLVAN
jgi:hypothetical protein